MPPDTSTFRTTTKTLLLAGLCVMILGIRFAYTYDPDGTASAGDGPIHSDDVARFLPVIVGGLLTFVAGVRFSLLITPWRLVILGLALVCLAVLGPAAVSVYIPAMKDFSWTGPVLVPLFIGRILGFTFISTAILRRFAPQNTNTRGDGKSPESDPS
jgi:hypothetical protein